MPSANDEYFDAQLRRQIAVRQLTSGEAAAILALLQQADADLVRQLRKALAQMSGKPVDFKGARLKTLLKDIRATRAELLRTVASKVESTLKQVGKLEANFEVDLLGASIPIEISIASVPLETLKALVTEKPIHGRLLNEWFSTLKAAEQRGITDAIQIGLAQGEDVDTIVRRIAGTRARRYKDGVLAITRRGAEAIVRTGVNHISNAAREAVWLANADIVLALRWTATLDGRTTAICRGRDGALVLIGDNKLPKGERLLKPQSARPPAHVQCRSIMVAVLNWEGIIGERPFVVDTRTPDRRKIDFRKIAKERGLTVKQVRDTWANKNIGRVPAKTTYNDWLKRQSPAFQEDVLGPTRAKLFQTGKIHLDEFIDRKGKTLTLAQLADQKPELFKAAGLDAEDF